MSEFDLLVDEAAERLREGVAEDRQDAMEQLVDEGLLLSTEVDAMDRALAMGGFR